MKKGRRSMREYFDIDRERIVKILADCIAEVIYTIKASENPSDAKFSEENIVDYIIRKYEGKEQTYTLIAMSRLLTVHNERTRNPVIREVAARGKPEVLGPIAEASMIWEYMNFETKEELIPKVEKILIKIRDHEESNIEKEKREPGEKGMPPISNN